MGGLGFEHAIAHQSLVTQDLITSLVLGLVHPLIGPRERHTGRVVVHHLGETETDGDLVDLRKDIGFHIATETLKRLHRIFFRATAQQHHKLFATKAVEAIVVSERLAHDARYQHQHLVTNQVTKPVIDQLEKVDVHHTQPIAGGRRGPPLDGKARIVLCRHRRLEEGGIERLPVQQSCERITLTRLQQVLEVGKHPQQGLDRLEGLHGQRLVRHHLQHTGQPQFHHQGQDRDKTLCRVNEAGRRQLRLLQQTGVQHQLSQGVGCDGWQ